MELQHINNRKAQFNRSNTILLFAGIIFGLLFRGTLLLAEPDNVRPTPENEPPVVENSYVISEIASANRLNSTGDLYTIILQSSIPPKKATLIRIARKLWQNRLPRTSQFLEIQFHLPQIETRDLPYAALTVNADGIQSVNIQDWILERSHSDIKFGLSLKTRQEIFQQLSILEQKSESSHSLADVGSQLRERFHISKRIQDAIVFEGITGDWSQN